MQKIKVAVTAGIGSGKSTAIRCIQNMGHPVFSCDEIYKEVIHSPNYIEKIKQKFPTVVFNNKIDRALLGRLVFNDPKKRELLNKIAHPLIMQTLFEHMNKCEKELVFAEVPLLFEGNFENAFDKVIVITRKLDSRMLAIRERDGIEDLEIKKRIQSQFDYDSKEGLERLKKCKAYIVENEWSLDKLYKDLKSAISNF